MEQLQALNIEGAQNARVPTAFGTSDVIVMGFEGEYQGQTIIEDVEF